ncbi:hypothetical protein ACLKA6_000634 [Drosophila palustris]
MVEFNYYESEFPVGASVLRTDFYVDDLLTGADAIEELKEKKDQIIALVEKANLQMTKFQSSSADLIATFAHEVPIKLEEEGPEFLKRSSEDWPRLTEPLPSPIEVRKRTTMVCRDSSKLTTGSKCDQASTVESQKDATIGDSKSIINQIIENSSSHSRTLRILSYVYRIYNRVMPNRLLKVRDVVHIPAAELNVTFWRIVGHIQQSALTEEIRLLANKKILKTGMQNLAPFIHEMQLEDNVSVKVIRSHDPNDGSALTPAHLLIGSSLLSAPEKSLYKAEASSQLRYLDRWQKVTFLKQQFWNLWHRDYIHTLQRRSKWTAAQPVTSAIPGKDEKADIITNWESEKEAMVLQRLPQLFI